MDRTKKIDWVGKIQIGGPPKSEGGTDSAYQWNPAKNN